MVKENDLIMIDFADLCFSLCRVCYILNKHILEVIQNKILSAANRLKLSQLLFELQYFEN